MIHPSYVELMRVVNDDVVIGEEPVVNSRYSIVCATAKRARQLINGSYPLKNDPAQYAKKPLSVAVDELYSGDLKILTEEEAFEQYEKLVQLREENRTYREERKKLEAEMTVDVDEKDASEEDENTDQADADSETFDNEAADDGDIEEAEDLRPDEESAETDEDVSEADEDA